MTYFSLLHDLRFPLSIPSSHTACNSVLQLAESKSPSKILNRDKPDMFQMFSFNVIKIYLHCRLLNMDINRWAHLNCALWSSEVFETMNGALMNVDGAYTRGQTIDCTLCKTKGATVGCFNMRCPKYYHLGCAKKAGCLFFQDKVKFN